jgi:hypothetical protein
MLLDLSFANPCASNTHNMLGVFGPSKLVLSYFYYLEEKTERL